MGAIETDDFGDWAATYRAPEDEGLVAVVLTGTRADMVRLDAVLAEAGYRRAREARQWGRSDG